MVPEQSPSWDDRQHGNFTYEQVYPCNEGFPGVVRIGPIEGGWPMIFDVVLSDGVRSQGMVSTELIDDLPSWLLIDDQHNYSAHVSYYDIAGWATPSGDYDRFERVILWLIRHWPWGH